MSQNIVIADVLETCAQWVRNGGPGLRKVELVADVGDVAWLNQGLHHAIWAYAPGVVNRGALMLDHKSFPTLKIVEEKKCHYFQWRFEHLVFRVPVSSVRQIRSFFPETTVMTFDIGE